MYGYEAFQDLRRNVGVTGIQPEEGVWAGELWELLPKTIMQPEMIWALLLGDPVPHGGNHGDVGAETLPANLLRNFDDVAGGPREPNVGDAVKVDDTADPPSLVLSVFRDLLGNLLQHRQVFSWDTVESGGVDYQEGRWAQALVLYVVGMARGRACAWKRTGPKVSDGTYIFGRSVFEEERASQLTTIWDLLD